MPTLLERGAVPRLLLTLGALFRLTLEPAEQMLRPNMDAAVAAAMSQEAEGVEEEGAGFYTASRTEDGASAAEALRTWLLFASYTEDYESDDDPTPPPVELVEAAAAARARRAAEGAYQAAIKQAAALFDDGVSLDRLFAPSRLRPGAPLPTAAELSWLACLALNPAGAGGPNPNPDPDPNPNPKPNPNPNPNPNPSPNPNPNPHQARAARATRSAR